MSEHAPTGDGPPGAARHATCASPRVQIVPPPAVFTTSTARRAGGPVRGSDAGAGAPPAAPVRRVPSGTGRRGYPWHALTPLPLLAALAGVAIVTVMAVGGIRAMRRATDAALMHLMQQSDDASHIWGDLSTQRAETEVALLAPRASSAALLQIEHATADAHRRIADLTGPTGESGLPPADRRLVADLAEREDGLLRGEQLLLHAMATGQAGAADAQWEGLDASLATAEAQAHTLWQDTRDRLPGRVATLTSAADRSAVRRLLLAFGLAAGEFAFISVWAGRAVARPLDSFTVAADAVARGDLRVRMPSYPIREFTALAESFNTMATALEAMRREEEETHRQALALQAERTLVHQRRLQLVLDAQEQERRRIARDLHDDTSQALAALQFGLADLARDLPGGARPRIEELLQLSREAMTTVHDLAADMHPHALDDLGLAAALRDRLTQLASRAPFEVQFETPASLPRLPAWLETAVFRIAQEAVTNATRHAAGARRLQVALRVADGCLRLTVADDGAGFRPEADTGTTRGLGLPSMRERAAQVGGTLDICSAPGAGTRVELTIPRRVWERPQGAVPDAGGSPPADPVGQGCTA